MVGPKGGVGLFDPATGKFDDRFASVETPSATLEEEPIYVPMFLWMICAS